MSWDNKKSNKKSYLHVQVTLIALVILLTSARAQSVKTEAPAVSSQNKTQNDPAREQNSREMEQLKLKVEQLESLVQQQQQELRGVLKRLGELDVKARAVVPVTSSDKIAITPDLRAAALGPHADSTNVAPVTEAAVQDKPAPVAGWNNNHAFLRSADGAFETDLTGYGQFDFRGYQAGNHPPNTFLIRRARLALEGTLARYFDFKVEGDFADNSSTLLRDFYLNIHRVDEFQLRFGQFRVPFSQEEIRRDQLQDFVERSMVNNLVPSRSPGLMASGVFKKGAFEYQIGAFNGKGLLANNNNGTPESAIRLRIAPWKNGKEFISKGFIFGGAFTQGRSLGGTSVRGQTESRSFSFFVPDAINGKYIRANGELTWMLGPAAIRAEYDQTNQRRDNLGAAGQNPPGVVAKGYTAQFTYLLTGEEKPEAGAVTPKNNLFGSGNGKHGYGAWELKFRYANLQIADGTAKSNRADSFYFGPNWYLNRFIRYMLDLGFERFKDSARSPKPGDRNFFVVMSRVQVAF